MSTKKYLVLLTKCCACSPQNSYRVFSWFGCSYSLAFLLVGNKHKTGISLALQEYLQLTKKYYNAEPQSVNFVGAADEIRREINSKVEHQTEGKLQHLLSKFKEMPFWHWTKSPYPRAQGSLTIHLRKVNQISFPKVIIYRQVHSKISVLHLNVGGTWFTLCKTRLPHWAINPN